MRYPTPTGRLTVEGVSFFFPRQTRPALHDISFQLEPGVSLGLIGPSASGKSTLARLLVGVWPARAGTVRLDGIDVFSWERSDSARHVGYLPQDVHLLEGSVKENIARLDQDAPDAMVIEAAKAAHAHELILRLPDGYDTQLGDDGTNLSGGQRQRIALARALYGDPRLLVLDEPSAHLDHEGEAALVDALEAAKARGATVVIIAHKPSILGQTDKMAVLKNGRLEMFGPRPEIMARTTRPAAVPVASVARLATHGEREPG
jgi:ABC-type protease/lipase transport system fused ATPase/permease subunit